jgi:hypothetical protein
LDMSTTVAFRGGKGNGLSGALSDKPKETVPQSMQIKRNTIFDSV